MVDEIVARGGEVFFDTFMELALYHPRHGYYSGSKPHYGREGDFLTAPSASSWYGTMLTSLLRQLGADAGPGRLIDVASGDGMLVSRVLDTLGIGANAVVDEILSVERSPSMRGRQLDRLWFRGGFPLSYLAPSHRASDEWRHDFIRTFLERDMPRLGGALPAATLERGYAIVTLPEGPIVRDPAQVTRGQDVSVRVAKGRFSARVTDEDQERS